MEKEVRAVKLSVNTQLEVDTSNLEWLLSLINDEGELPIYALKYVTIVAAT